MPSGMGSGFVVARIGLVVTSWHVVQNGRRIHVLTTAGTQAARIVARDPSNDLAVLQIDASLPAAISIRPSRQLTLGTDVFTIGFPNPEMQGFSPKYSRGEISSIAGPIDDRRILRLNRAIQNHG